MLTSLTAWLEATALAQALRDSAWIYPLINAGHILGVALLLGNIIALDLRLLGCWRQMPLAPLWNMARRMAAMGLALAVACGLLLFAARATEYVASAFFQAKMAVIGVLVINAVWVSWIGSQMVARSGNNRAPRAIRMGAALSLCGWVGALTLGRLVGYF